MSGDLVLDRHGRATSASTACRATSACARRIRSVRSTSTPSAATSRSFAPRIEQLRAATVSGDVELEGTCADGPEHRIETVSGDPSLGVVGGLTLEVRGLSTDADVRLPHRCEGSRDRRRYVIGDGGAQLLFSSMSGDIDDATCARRTGDAATATHRRRRPHRLRRDRPSIDDDEQLEVLRALERGEIDVDEAARRLGGGEIRCLRSSRPSCASSPRAPDAGAGIADHRGADPGRAAREISRPSTHSTAKIERSRLGARSTRRSGARSARGRARARTQAPGELAGRGRQLRIRVTEHGRQVVNLRIPIGFVETALSFVPGLGGDQASASATRSAPGAVARSSTSRIRTAAAC